MILQHDLLIEDLEKNVELFEFVKVFMRKVILYFFYIYGKL